jgi:hypothetical protein
MSLFGKFLSPKLAVNIIRKQLSAQLGRPVENFTIMYLAQTDILQFQVDGMTANFDNDAVKSILKAQLKKQVKPGQMVDVITATADKDSNVTAVIYITENGLKQKLTYKL